MSTRATAYDLRYLAGPILDQGQIGACMPFSITSQLDMVMRLVGHEIMPLSPMYNYATTRTAQGTFSTDSGSNPEVALGQVVSKGIAFESSWAYGPANLYAQPTAEVHAEAAQHKASGFTEVYPYQAYSGFADSVRTLLSEGKPVILGFRLREWFTAKDGALADQVNYGKTGAFIGGHAVVIVGMDDALNGGSYIVKNSWGTAWGDNGYGTIRYSQFAPNPMQGGTYIPPDIMGLWTFDGFDGLNFKYTTERVDIAQDYAMLLKRGGDIAGVDYWAGLLTGGASKALIADMMIGSAEGAVFYGTDTNAEFVIEMYETILGREADAGGVAFWSGLIDGGQSRGAVAMQLMDAMEAPGAEALARDHFMNKSNLSSYISIAMQYDGAHQAEVQQAIADVTSDANQVELIKIGLHFALH